MITQTMISKQSAIKLLEKPSILFQKKRSILHLEILSMPYYLFEADIIIKNGQNQHTTICVDGISGEYAFRNKNLNIQELQTSDIKFKINETKAKQIANRAVNQFIVTNMKKSILLEEVKINLIDTFSYPYWLGLYANDEKGIKFDVIDGLTGQKQGPKMIPVFIKLIIQQKETSFQNGDSI